MNTLLSNCIKREGCKGGVLSQFLPFISTLRGILALIRFVTYSDPDGQTFDRISAIFSVYGIFNVLALCLAISPYTLE